MGSEMDIEDLSVLGTGNPTETLTMQEETLMNPPRTVTMEMATQSAVPIRPKETVPIAVAASKSAPEDQSMVSLLKLKLKTSQQNEKAMAKELKQREEQMEKDKENKSTLECVKASTTCKRKQVSLLCHCRGGFCRLALLIPCFFSLFCVSPRRRRPLLKRLL